MGVWLPVTRKQGPRGDMGQGCGHPPSPSTGRGGSPCLLFPLVGGGLACVQGRGGHGCTRASGPLRVGAVSSGTSVL